MHEWLELLAGGLLLYFGAEWFVGGASALALALRMPQIIIGLTVVAYGTSAPEVIVGVESALAGRGTVALGNVIGSNIANIGLILGITALVKPPWVDRSLGRRELPILITSTTAVPVLLLDGSVSRGEGTALIGVALAYTVWMVRTARSRATLREATYEAAVTARAADAAGAPRLSKRPAYSATVLLIGLGVLLLGGRLFVQGAVEVARSIGVSDRVVGLTIVAVGTSLPELVTSLIAALRGHSEIAVGNVVGSNIFNVLLCLGSAAVAGRLEASLREFQVDLVMMVFVTGFAGVFIRTARTISRTEGALLLAAYVAFAAWVASGRYCSLS